MTPFGRAAAILASLLGLAAFAAPSLARPEAPTVRLRGAITRVAGNELTVRTVGGKEVPVVLAPNARVTEVLPAQLADIVPGRFVGTAARPEAGGRWRAIEVHIFPPGARLGEGHRPWGPEAGATMTNADVTAMVTHAGNGALTLTTGGKNYAIDVPRGTPIVALEPGTRALLKPGATAVVRAKAGPNGTLAASAITVSKVPHWPPK